MRQHVNDDESAIPVRVSVISEPLDQPFRPRAKHVLGRGPNTYSYYLSIRMYKDPSLQRGTELVASLLS